MYLVWFGSQWLCSLVVLLSWTTTCLASVVDTSYPPSCSNSPLLSRIGQVESKMEKNLWIKIKAD